MKSFDVDQESGLLLLREREIVRPRFCSMGAAQQALAAYGTSAVGPRRYWGIRINLVQTGSDWPGYGELSFHSANGGLNLSAGGTLLTTTSFNGSQDHAFDGYIGVGSANTWDGGSHNVGHPNATVPVIDYIDFGAGNEKSIRQVRLMAAESTFSNGMPKDFDIVYSDNGSTWNTAWSVTFQIGWNTTGEIRTFTDPTYSNSYSGSKYGSHSYWRVQFFANSGGGVYGLADMEMRATPSGSNQTSGGTASASSTFSGLSAANAFDGNSATVWGNASGVALGHWLKYAFASPVTVAEIAIRSRNDASYNQGPTYGIVQFSDDNTNWTNAWNFSTTAWTQNVLRAFTDPDYV